MSWDKQKSLDRIKKRWEARDTEVTVTKLTRNMNLENVTLRNGRLIRGAHLYSTVAGSGGLDALGSAEDAQSAIQRIALWQAEVARIAGEFDVPIVAFQGARVHLLVYRPIDDDALIARRAALLGRAITLMTRDAFNPLFDESLQFTARAATDLGETVATRGGTRGDSELLFLGTAANRPAKLLGSTRLIATKRFTDALGEQLELEKELKAGEGDAYVLRISAKTVQDAVVEDKIDWSVEKSAKRLEEELEKWPTERFKTSGAKELIDPSALSRSNSKFIDAAVILLDLDGFSAYVERAEADTTKRDAILALDAIRQEMREVLKVDNNGVRVQYQGDNMIGFVHLPEGDQSRIAESVVEVAAGMQSSMNVTLPEVILDALGLDAAIGVSLADTVISSLGSYGRRNAIALGAAATRAERTQMAVGARAVGIDSATYDSLSEAVRELFSWSDSVKAYVADSLDAAKLERVKEATAMQSERIVTPGQGGRFGIGGAATAEREHVRPVRPYAE